MTCFLSFCFCLLVFKTCPLLSCTLLRLPPLPKLAYTFLSTSILKNNYNCNQLLKDVCPHVYVLIQWLLSYEVFMNIESCRRSMEYNLIWVDNLFTLIYEVPYEGNNCFIIQLHSMWEGFRSGINMVFRNAQIIWTKTLTGTFVGSETIQWTQHVYANDCRVT